MVIIIYLLFNFSIQTLACVNMLQKARVVESKCTIILTQHGAKHFNPSCYIVEVSDSEPRTDTQNDSEAGEGN